MNSTFELNGRSNIPLPLPPPRHKVMYENRNDDVAADENEADNFASETGVPDLATESRIEALRLLVLAFLREVDNLRETVSSPKKKRQLVNLDEEVDAFEAALIREALIKANGKQREAAKILKIKPSTLNAKMKRLHIEVRRRYDVST